jgi:hypothetical protein
MDPNFNFFLPSNQIPNLKARCRSALRAAVGRAGFWGRLEVLVAPSLWSSVQWVPDGRNNPGRVTRFGSASFTHKRMQYNNTTDTRQTNTDSLLFLKEHQIWRCVASERSPRTRIERRHLCDITIIKQIPVDGASFGTPTAIGDVVT